MKRTKMMAVLVTAATVIVVGATCALAVTDVPTSAAVFERVFNDCPTSILNVTNNYPGLISIDDTKNGCGGGFANRHCWRFSQNGTDAQLFANNGGFRFETDVTVSGTGEGEAGIGISPWWSQLVDGIFNLRTTDGEIACFGGRLPFYSFTGSQGVTYTKGDMIHMGIEYLPNGLSEGAPGTIEYTLDYNGMSYTSGQLPFDMGNPDEDPPYGLWGILNDSTAGGYVQFFIQDGADDANLMVEWGEITFMDLGDVVATEDSSWSNVKALYR